MIRVALACALLTGCSQEAYSIREESLERLIPLNDRERAKALLPAIRESDGTPVYVRNHWVTVGPEPPRNGQVRASTSRPHVASIIGGIALGVSAAPILVGALILADVPNQERHGMDECAGPNASLFCGVGPAINITLEKTFGSIFVGGGVALALVGGVLLVVGATRKHVGEVQPGRRGFIYLK